MVKWSALYCRSDPLSKYNFVIKTYNDPINRENETFLRKVHTNAIYKFWFFFQSRLSIWLFISCFVPYLNTFILTLNIITFIVSELAAFIFSSNQRKVGDPLKNMIYNPDICKQGGKSYLYFEVTEEELETFNYHKETVVMLTQRKHKYDFKIRFMVYNDEFITCYCEIAKARLIVLSHFIFCVVAVVNMHLFVYSDFLCLNVEIAKSSTC